MTVVLPAPVPPLTRKASRPVTMRRSHPALAIGDIAVLPSQPDVLQYLRRQDDETLLVALNLGGLYDAILTAMMPVSKAPGEDIQARVARMETIRAKSREVERIKARLSREKQFNKRVAINAELRTAKQELERLAAGDPVGAVTEK